MWNLLPSNVRAFAEAGLADKGLPISKGFDETFLSSGDLKYLQEKGLEKLKKGTLKTGLGYDDWGFAEDEVLKLAGNKPSAFMRSMVNPAFRMATLLGLSDLKVEDGNLIITDLYNFNPGPKRIKYKKLVDEGKTKEAAGFLKSQTPIEQATLKAFLNQKEDKESGKIRINLGSIKELLATKE